MTIEPRALTLTYDNATQYLTADNITLAGTYLGYELAFRSKAKTGYAVLSDAAKEVLFPNTAAHPVQADSSMSIGASTTSANNYVELEFGGVSVHHLLCSAVSEEKTGLTPTAVTGATAATAIQYKLNINNLFVAGMCQTATLTLYFNRYACAVNAAGNGIASVTVSDVAPWDGDSVTFTATVKTGAEWHGWYSDAACTQLVSANQSYTMTANADLTLYAYATCEVLNTGIYYKRNGVFAGVNAAYKKVNGAWVNADKTDFDSAVKYKVIEVTA